MKKGKMTETMSIGGKKSSIYPRNLLRGQSEEKMTE